MQARKIEGIQRHGATLRVTKRDALFVEEPGSTDQSGASLRLEFGAAVN
jgi:hypothetical protein